MPVAIMSASSSSFDGPMMTMFCTHRVGDIEEAVVRRAVVWRDLTIHKQYREVLQGDVVDDWS